MTDPDGPAAGDVAREAGDGGPATAPACEYPDVGREAGDGGPATAPARDYPRAFWPAVVVGWALMAVGAAGLAGWIGHFAGPVPWLRAGAWVVGVALVHDLVVAPLACLAGVVTARLLPRPYRGPVVGALLVAAVVTAVAVPGLRGWGRLAGNPSVQPLNYATGLGTVLAVVAAGALVVAAVARRR